MHKLKNFIESVTGYWIFKARHLPVGSDIHHDLKRLISSNFNFTTVFDVGANTGQTAVNYSSLFSDAQIFSFEPVRTTFEQLSKNIEDLRNVTGFQLALGSKNEQVEIQLDQHPTSVTNTLRDVNIRPNEIGTKEVVRVSTIADFMREKNIESIDLLKIDTEGYELEVLKGAGKLMLRNKVQFILCEVGFTSRNNWHTPFNELNTFLSNHNFGLCGIYDIGFNGLPKGLHFGNALWMNQDVHKT